MRLLVLGGTIFLGRHFVDLALAHGHEVTLFNRGKHNSDLFPGVEKIHGDRRGDLTALSGRTWDAVLDTCGYIPREVKASAELLADSVGHYAFISSVSVYSDNSIPNMDESGAVGTLGDESIEEITGESYGPLKALCEQAAEAAMPGRVLNVRAGLIVGPWDPSDRFTYWPHRVAEGGEVMAPRGPEVPTQYIDVRDLAAWVLLTMESNRVGTFNATGPNFPLTLGRVLEECRLAAGGDAKITWVGEKFLLENGVAPWMDLPLWLPAETEYAGFNTINCDAAIANGLAFRPVGETVADTLRWDRTMPADRALRAGLTREREAELLKLWRSGGGVGE